MARYTMIALLMASNLAFGQSAPNWTSVNPKTVYPSGRKGSPEHRNYYGGTVYRPASSSILFYDGYVGEEFESSIYANAMASLSVKDNTVNVLKITESAPTNRHTWEAFVYVDTEDALYMLYGAHQGCPGGATGMWKFKFADNEWSEVKANLPDAYGCEGHMAYWKAGGKLIYISGENEAYEFTLATSTWAKITIANASAMDAYRSMTTWDTRADQWIFRNGDNVAAYTPSTHSFKALPSANLSYSAITYIPKYDVYMAAGAPGSQTKIYNKAKGAWETLPGKVPNYQTDDEFVYLQYDPANDAELLLSDNREFFTMKYVGSPVAVKTGKTGANWQPGPNDLADPRSGAWRNGGVRLYGLQGSLLPSSPVAGWEGLGSGTYVGYSPLGPDRLPILLRQAK